MNVCMHKFAFEYEFIRICTCCYIKGGGGLGCSLFGGGSQSRGSQKTQCLTNRAKVSEYLLFRVPAILCN